jgi:hypothetical protein
MTLRILLLALALLGCSKTEAPPAGTLVDTPVIVEFRAGERATLQRFNDALGRQRANQIDELGLAEVIDTQVLPPWRELRAHVTAAPVPQPDRELFATLTRYLGERENAWQAYSAALRAGNDAAAAPHYATYHEQDAAADTDARALGAMFRQLSPKPGSLSAADTPRTPVTPRARRAPRA